MMTAIATCIFFGGRDRPINPATLYRGVKDGRFPAPVRIGGISRWRRSECIAAREAMTKARAKGNPEQPQGGEAANG
jgi:hypothetical protein